MSTLTKIEDIVIYRDEDYNSFPNIIRKADGELLVTFRSAPDRIRLLGNAHVDAKSKAVYVTSRDNGRTWSEKPEVLYDDYCFGVQDPCLNVLKDGTILCSIHTWQVLLKTDVPELNPTLNDHILSDKWVARQGGAYTLRSQDGGSTWEEPVPVANARVRGNMVELTDGSILLPLYREGGSSKPVIYVTTDQGRSWNYLSTIYEGKDFYFAEPNLYLTISGKLVAFMRSKKAGAPEEQQHPLVTCESYDHGKTWGEIVEQPIYYLNPFHALRLQSGNVLLTYGSRYEPYGVRARILNSECTNIAESEEVILRDDAFGRDIAYTHALQLDNGDILIVYYHYTDGPLGKRYIAGTFCRE